MMSLRKALKSSYSPSIPLANPSKPLIFLAIVEAFPYI
jgi:hypothetical protein